MNQINETTELRPAVYRTAALDEAHIGDINGAFGTIRHGDHGPRIGMARTCNDAARHPRTGTDRDGGRQ